MIPRRLGICLLTCFSVCFASDRTETHDLLFVANQIEHTVLVVDPTSKQVRATVGVDINGHEVAVYPDGRFGYVPIYGNTWVGKPGSNGRTIHVVDLRHGMTVAVIDLGKEVRPHSAHFGPDGLLYVSAELANAIYIVDPKTRSLVGQIPTDASHTHMIAPDGGRIYTANNEPGSVSVLDLETRSLLATTPISKTLQRISISADGKFVYTQDQQTPRIVVIDTTTNSVIRSIPLPRIVFSSVITRDGRWLLANSESGKLLVVDLASGTVTKSFDTPDVPTPGEFALARDDIHAYLSSPQGGTIEVLNLKDWKLEEPIRLTKGVDTPRQGLNSSAHGSLISRNSAFRPLIASALTVIRKQPQATRPVPLAPHRPKHRPIISLLNATASMPPASGTIEILHESMKVENAAA